MRGVVAILMLLVALALPQRVDAQYNRNYIYWMGQQKMEIGRASCRERVLRAV